MKRKRPIRWTPEMQATGVEVRRELDRRIAVITAELEAVASPWLAVEDEDLLAYAVARIDAELAA
jgi:hypothetical protein